MHPKPKNPDNPEIRLSLLESRMEEHESIILKLSKRVQKNTFQLDQVAFSFSGAIAFLLIIAFGIEIQTDSFRFDLSGETLVKIIEGLGISTIVATIAPHVIAAIKKSNKNDEG